MKKSLLVFAVMMFTLGTQFASARDAKELYNKSCVACHSTGAAGAPKAGDVAAWTPRLAKGVDTLVKNTKTGVKAMPPKGMCMDCTDEEFKALISFMSAVK